MSAIEVLKEIIKEEQKNYEEHKQNYDELPKRYGNNHLKRIGSLKEALLALEQKEKLSKWLDDVEGFETKEFRATLEKSLFGKLVGTCKVREIMNLKKERVGEQK